MDKKYFETKTGSLEDVSTKIAKEQPTITKKETTVKLTTEKNYLGNKPGSLSDIAAKIVNEETILEFTSQQIKMAYGILNDPRYKQGNYDGAVKAIEKLAKGLSNHPDVKNALKRANEAVDPVNKDAVKKDFTDRKDKDLDNDGDTDSSDEYLHKKRQAISKSMKENKAYMLSYGKKGEKAKFFYGNSLSDIQNKAHELRKQGIVVDKMGRTEPTHKLRQTIEAVNPDDKGEKQNADKVKAYTDPKGGEKSVIKPLQELEKECPQCQGKGCDHCDDKGTHTVKENKKTFKEIRIQAGEGPKTDTGKKTAIIDTEPSTKPI